jgi:uroporphyrin-III C-methyltransferase
MGVARISSIISTLVDPALSPSPYPKHLPIAIVERGSMPDQRAILSTLENVVSALEGAGEQRPPGMMVIGWAVLAARVNGLTTPSAVPPPHGTDGLRPASEGAGEGETDGRAFVDGTPLVDVLGPGAEKDDLVRVEKWLGGRRWAVKEGLEDGWEQFQFADATYSGS